jgi:hypothetical protein
LRRAGPRFLPATQRCAVREGESADCRINEIGSSQARAPDGSGMTAIMAIARSFCLVALSGTA